jgi:hypothetical protein
MQSREN